MKKIILTGMIALLGSFILLPSPSLAKDLYCQMPYNVNVLCQLTTQGDTNTVNCSKSGKPGLSYRCLRSGPGWKCESKESRGASVQQFSDVDFQNDVKRCDKLCEFCVFDWKESLERQIIDTPKKEEEAKKPPDQQQTRPPVTGPMSCSTSCKNGLAEYRGKWSRWNCNFEPPSAAIPDQPNLEAWRYSTCAIGIEGRFKAVASEKGSYKEVNECFERFCVPKLNEICGSEDRCSDAKNWTKIHKSSGSF